MIALKFYSKKSRTGMSNGVFNLHRCVTYSISSVAEARDRALSFFYRTSLVLKKFKTTSRDDTLLSIR